MPPADVVNANFHLISAGGRTAAVTIGQRQSAFETSSSSSWDFGEKFNFWRRRGKLFSIFAKRQVARWAHSLLARWQASGKRAAGRFFPPRSRPHETTKIGRLETNCHSPAPGLPPLRRHCCSPLCSLCSSGKNSNRSLSVLTSFHVIRFFMWCFRVLFLPV